MILLKIIITIFILFAIINLINQKRNDKINFSTFVMWLIIWISVEIVFWKPDISTTIANYLGIGRGSDLMIYISIITIFYMLFKIFSHINKIESQITKIAREIALITANDNKNNNKQN